MAQPEFDLCVGADPAKSIVALRLTAEDKQHHITCVLDPDQAEEVAGWLREAVAHARARPGPTFYRTLERPGLHVSVHVTANAKRIALMLGDDGPAIGGIPLNRNVAEKYAEILTTAAREMRAQARGEIDIRNVRTLYPPVIKDDESE